MKHTYIDFDEKNNKEDFKFKFCDHIRILKYKNIFAKGYVPNRSKEVFVIRKILLQGHMLLVILRLKKLLESFTKNNYKKLIKKNLG